MIVARERKNENLAEYIIYMWQLEDMLRGLNLDIEEVNRRIVESYQVDEEKRKEIRDWYENLIEMMKQEKIETSGHLQVVKNSVNELTELHFYLLHTAHDPKYHQLVTMAIQNFVDFRKRAGVSDEISDVELALHGLYGSMMLRLKGEEVSSETKQAMESFSRVLAYLAAKYRQIEEEEKQA